MDKLKTILLVIAILVISVLVFLLMKNFNKKDEQDNSKVISEIKYMDERLTYLLNEMNNIKLENSSLVISKTSTTSSAGEGEGDGQNGAEESSSSKQGGGESSGESQGGASGESSNASGGDSGSTSPNEQYTLKQSGILTNSNYETNWDNIKTNVEAIYNLVPTITLDLYNGYSNQNEILNFNKELDNLTVAIKNENKEETLNKLSTLHDYLPRYAKELSKDSRYQNFLEVKSNILSAYSYIDSNNWQEINNHVKKAIEIHMQILNSMEYSEGEYETNKIYIILNELLNAANIQDAEVFLIKYKTFLQEI